MLSTSAGPRRLPATLIVSSLAAVEEPVPVLVDARPVAVAPHAGAPRASRCRGSARGRPRRPRVMPGQGCVHTSSPTSPAPAGVPSGPNTSTSMPSAGPPSVQGLSSLIGCGDRKHAPTSVPPERLMIGSRPPPTSSKNHRYGSGFHGSPVEARIRRRREVVRADRLVARAGSSARISVGETPRCVMRCRSTIDQRRSGPGWFGRAVVQEHRRAERRRADDLPRSHDPAEVGDPEQQLARVRRRSGRRPPRRS